jgi:hypothetical protein
MGDQVRILTDNRSPAAAIIPKTLISGTCLLCRAMG